MKNIEQLIVTEKMREQVDKDYVQLLQRLSDKDFLTLDDFCLTRRSTTSGEETTHRYLFGSITENKDGFHFEINDATESDEVNTKFTSKTLAIAEAALFMVLSSDINQK